MKAEQIHGTEPKMIGLNTNDGLKTIIASVSGLKADKEGFVEVVAPLLCSAFPGPDGGPKYAVTPFVLMTKIGPHRISRDNILSVAEPDTEIASLYMDFLAGNLEGLSPNYQRERS